MYLVVCGGGSIRLFAHHKTVISYSQLHCRRHTDSNWLLLPLMFRFDHTTIPHFFTGRMPFLPPNQHWGMVEVGTG